MKCVQPAPLADENATDPSLAKKKGDCPRNPPKKFEVIGFKIEWGCDTLKIEGGEGLMASVEFNTAKKETTIWVGGGLEATADAGHGVSVGVEAKAGMGFTFGGPGGGLVDVSLTSEVSGEAKVPGHGIEGTFGTGISAEGGPSVTAKGQIGDTEYGGTYTNH